MLNFFQRTFDTAGGGAPAGGAPAPAAPAAPAPAAAPAAPAGDTGPWYKGTDDRIVGTWQNTFPQHINDPKELAKAATTSWLEAQKLLGAPADQLIRMPRSDDPAGMAALHKRLGRPDAATDYALKDHKGADLDPTTAEAFRNAAHKANLSKEAAATLAAEMAKFGEAQAANAQAEYDGKIAQAKTELVKNWGSNFAPFKEMAKAGAAALGFDREMVDALEKTVGYAKVMEALRKVGATTKEGQFVNGGQHGQAVGGAMTLEQAKAKLADLRADASWRTRFYNNEAGAKRELEQLEHIIAAAM